MKRIQKKKGFTMIEIIIVLVILAILIGAAVPSMMGFVSEARNKANFSSARTAYMAAQTVVTEYVGLGKTGWYSGNSFTGDALTTFKNLMDNDAEVAKCSIVATDSGLTSLTYNPGGTAKKITVTASGTSIEP